MKNFINLIITFVILALGNHFFPETIVFNGGWESILITSLLILVANILFSFIAIIIMLPMSFFDITQGIADIIIFILAFLWTPIKLYAVSHFYAGFDIVGGLGVYIILTLVLGFFTLGDSKKK